MTKKTSDDHYADVALVALWDGLSRNATMRDGVLAEMGPAARKDVWHEVAEARKRVVERGRKG